MSRAQESVRGSGVSDTFPEQILSPEASWRGAESFATHVLEGAGDEERRGAQPAQVVVSLRAYTQTGHHTGLCIAYFNSLLTDIAYREWAVRSDPRRVIPVLLFLLRALPLYATAQTAYGESAGTPGALPAYPTAEALVLEVVEKIQGGYDRFGRVGALLKSEHREDVIRDAIHTPYALAKQLGYPPHGAPPPMPQNAPQGCRSRPSP